MSDEYVVRASYPRGGDVLIWDRRFPTAEDAHSAIEEARCGNQTLYPDATVHKLSGPIPTPERREWVVVDKDGDVWGVATTRSMVEHDLVEASHDWPQADYRIARLVFDEDGAP